LFDFVFRNDAKVSQTHTHNDSFVLECIELISILKWDKFGIIGHSLGGGVALMLASAMTTRVTRLVVLDSLGPWAVDGALAAETLRQCATFATTPTSKFATLELAAEHRAKKNFG
jgi:pimeloyl-ACP methyl ester carboxylesterase